MSDVIKFRFQDEATYRVVPITPLHLDEVDQESLLLLDEFMRVRDISITISAMYKALHTLPIKEIVLKEYSNDNLYEVDLTLTESDVEPDVDVGNALMDLVTNLSNMHFNSIDLMRDLQFKEVYLGNILDAAEMLSTPEYAKAIKEGKCVEGMPDPENRQMIFMDEFGEEIILDRYSQRTSDLDGYSFSSSKSPDAQLVQEESNILANIRHAIYMNSTAEFIMTLEGVLDEYPEIHYARPIIEDRHSKSGLKNVIKDFKLLSHHDLGSVEHLAKEKLKSILFTQPSYMSITYQHSRLGAYLSERDDSDEERLNTPFDLDDLSEYVMGHAWVARRQAKLMTMHAQRALAAM